MNEHIFFTARGDSYLFNDVVGNDFNMQDLNRLLSGVRESCEASGLQLSMDKLGGWSVFDAETGRQLSKKKDLKEAVQSALVTRQEQANDRKPLDPKLQQALRDFDKVFPMMNFRCGESISEGTKRFWEIARQIE